MMTGSLDDIFRDFHGIPRGFADAAVIDQLKATGWDVLTTGLTLDFRKDWTLWHSVREFVQNALDETGDCDLSVGRVAAAIEGAPSLPVTVIEDRGKGFGAQSLLLGQQKGETVESRVCLRGRFGEGMKIGLIPALRARMRVFIRTAGLDIAAVNGAVRLGGQELRAVLLLTRANSRTSGTQVVIDGLDVFAVELESQSDENYRAELEGREPRRIEPVDLSLRFAPMLVVRRPEAVLHTLRGLPRYPGAPYDCQVRQLLDIPGALFVRDIYVGQIEGMVWGYNLWFDDAAAALDPNRDKLKLSLWGSELAKELTMLALSMPPRVMRAYFERLKVARMAAGRGSTRCWDYEVLEAARHYSTTVAPTEEQVRAVHKVYRDIIGVRDIAWAEGSEDQKTLEHAGHVNLHEVLPPFLQNQMEEMKLVTAPKALAKAVGGGAVFISIDKIVAWQRENVGEYGLAKDVIDAWREVDRKLNDLAKFISDQVAVDPPRVFFFTGDSTETREVSGFTDGQIVAIRLGQIPLGRVMRTFIHEMAHVESGMAADLTDAFEDALAKIGELVARVATDRPGWMKGLREALELLGRNDGVICWIGSNPRDFSVKPRARKLPT